MNLTGIKHFDPETDTMLACPCCGLCEIDHEFLILVDRARDMAGVPFRVTSGFRCPEWNRKVGGSASSSHLKGVALDLAVECSSQRFAILSSLLECGFTRVGIGSDFIHVDLDVQKDQRVAWGYK